MFSANNKNAKNLTGIGNAALSTDNHIKTELAIKNSKTVILTIRTVSRQSQ
jgi:hypothetical protein